MIHTKSLIRRLACGSWLLAAGLVLGWAGVASAVRVDLTLDKTKVREDAGETTITAKAKVAADAAADIVVVLGLTDATNAQNVRYRIELPTITIPKGKKEATGSIKFTPITDNLRGTDVSDDGAADDLVLTITGNAGASNSVNHATAGNNVGVMLTLIDDDKISTSFDLSFDPGDLSNEAATTSVTVTGTLNGSLAAKDNSFTLAFRNASGVTNAEYNAGVEPDLTGNEAAMNAARDTLVLRRDSDYSATAAALTLRKKRMSGKATITIDPKESKKHDAYIALEAVGIDTLQGIDLNLDGDTGDTFSLTFEASGDFRLEERVVDVDYAGNGDKVDYVSERFFKSGFTAGDSTGLGFDLNLDGSLDNAGSDGSSTTTTPTGTNFTAIASCNGPTTSATTRCNLREADLKFLISTPPAFFKVKDAPIADVKSDGLVATPSMVRENAGRTEVELKVTLKAAVNNDQSVRFTVLTGDDCPDEDDFDCRGRRDIDYTVDVSDLTIPAGETSATTTLVLTPVDNTAAGGSLGFQVTARVGAGDTAGRANITIVDDETLTDAITLSVSPAELKAESGPQDVTVTGALNGKVFDEAVKVTLIISRDGPDEGTTADDNAAQRDTDYTAVIRSLTIPAGAVEGSTTVSITPLQGGDKKIFLTALKSPVKNDDDEDVTVSIATVTLKDADATTAPTASGDLSFGTTDLGATVFPGTVGKAIEPIELPEAEGGEGAKSYSVSATLPAGL